MSYPRKLSHAALKRWWKATVAGAILLSVGATCSKTETPTPPPTTTKPSMVTTKVPTSIEQIAALVRAGKLDELAKIELPDTPYANKLRTWTFDYIAEMRQAEKLQTQHYEETATKAQDLFKRKDLEDASDKLVGAYLLATDKEAFLEITWVKDLISQLAVKAADYEKAGKWLESLQLYTNLNSLYEVDTRYKADMQRLNRRTRLLALYVPKVLFETRKNLAAKLDQDKDKKEPETRSILDDEEPAFSRWQDHVQGIAKPMTLKAIDEARDKWVEPTSFETLLRGGVEALRLFLTTPELATEFPELKDPKAREKFADALDLALLQIQPSEHMSTYKMHQIIDDLLAANQATIKLPTPVFLMEFTDGAMERLDPFTAVIWPNEVNDFSKSTRGKFGGVGIQISMENGVLKVISPLEDTPAFAAGIEAGDVVTAIDGKTTTGISIDQAVHQITGEPNTPVVLTIKREGRKDPLTFTLKRALIHVVSVKGMKRDTADPTKWQFMIDNENKIGYIRITGFQEDTTAELKSALQTLQEQGCRGVILDLRFNPGGLLKSAIEISQLFLNTDRYPAPIIVSTKGNKTQTSEYKARGTPYVSPSLPVVVMVNQYSASASEIFSGAIKDLHRGLIVGQRSFGKGSVQDVMPISDDEKAMFKLTKQYYYLPDGESLHRRDGQAKWGVEPDISVSMTPYQIRAMVEARRDADIIAKAAAATQAAEDLPAPEVAPTPDTQPASQPAATKPATKPAGTQKAPEPLLDTQLDTALLMMRLQLIQPHS